MSSAPDGDGAIAACALEQVVVRYGALTALDGVDLHVDRGEAVALVGPSGAGKTTLLRLLAGMVQPTSGAVLLGGRPVGELHPRRELTARVGMVQQRLDLVPQLSVRHNVQAGLLGRWGLLRSLLALALPVEHTAVGRAAGRVGLGDRLHTRVGSLSGGEQQRVGLARLLVQAPELVLADEPVAALDPARAEDLVGLLAALAREDGHTLLASLHTPELARRHFDRIVGLRGGRVVFDLPAAAVTGERFEAVYRLLGPLEGAESQPSGGAEAAAG